MAIGTSPKARQPINRASMRPQSGSPGARTPQDDSLEGNLRNVLEGQSAIKASLVQREDDDAVQTDAPLIRLVNSLLSEAVRRNASDIHIEPLEGALRVRFRIDGVLQEVQQIPLQLAPAITSRLKIMAALDICEKRMPQDGSIKMRQQNLDADFRISTLPSVFGEKVVMRVMGGAGVGKEISKLGIPEAQLKLFCEAIHRPDGLVLVTGPTGSGKTTTLYAALSELNDSSTSVFTAEDPVEGTLPGVTQCQVNSGVGYTFASILRSLLRQDPDVILVGEIRDQETAEISIKAALTGHLVLSTLHTNSAVATISRLLNMGIAPYLISSAVTCVVAQRLVRKICPDCKKEDTISADMLATLGPQGELLRGKQLWRGQGCPACHNSGFKGRAPLYEVLLVSDELRQLILAGATQDELKRVARVQGMITLREAGLGLCAEGITTVQEVLGVTNEDTDTTKLDVAANVAASLNLQAAPAPKSDAPPLAQPAQVMEKAVDNEQLRSAVKRWKSQKTARMQVVQ
ncbi:MAG: Flp pilus assembly complex ATPase component TadA [Oligoflexia bacterium]|nr:Flp pilus assembly complex ATPase component TadA [Oligoflexia bacterium]